MIRNENVHSVLNILYLNILNKQIQGYLFTLFYVKQYCRDSLLTLLIICTKFNNYCNNFFKQPQQLIRIHPLNNIFSIYSGRLLLKLITVSALGFDTMLLFYFQPNQQIIKLYQIYYKVQEYKLRFIKIVELGIYIFFLVFSSSIQMRQILGYFSISSLVLLCVGIFCQDFYILFIVERFIKVVGNVELPRSCGICVH
eukprot:TRINITY_DN3575_c0_g1_i1.p1 TRINITY_DN3575_c0_g1~~TRINITY_DN3575_c0_g1_i1.p1  ORF type:complete len:198 (+),score=-18.76 TRINITY_DN3575_c0_g1_i1:263-856(+)